MVEYGIAAGAAGAAGHGGGYGVLGSLDHWVAMLASPAGLMIAAAAVLLVWALR